MSKMTKKTQAFLNRAQVQASLVPEPTASCDEPVVFLLKDKYHEFSLDMKTLLTCLRFAEEQGAIPELPGEWWLSMNSRY